MTSNAAAPLSIFISYSHRDEDYKDDLVVHLATLKRQGKIRAWQDRDIEAGAEWDAEIKQQLESAEIILLLITPQFIASDYCYDLEMQRAVQRHEEGTARVIPIIVKPCDWEGTPFSKLQFVPKNAKPITKWDDQDDAFLNVVQSIRKAVESLQAKKSSGATTNNLPAVALTPSLLQFSTYNPTTFAGRDAETAHLTNLLSRDCRILAVVGMTGIGKTALAERVVAHLRQTPETATRPYYRFSLDDSSLTPDFSSSGAALLRTLGEEPTLADQQDPTNLLAHLLNHLQSQPCRVQIDSLERLLRGNEQDGWSEFCDPLWLDLLQQFLSATASPSQLLLTSQDIPGDLDAVASRYPQFWHCEALQGLSPDEQQTLFQKLGLPQDADSVNYLSRIGEFYDGHPLVLQVIADEICQPPFQGNVARYWHHYEAEFAAAATPTHTLGRSRLFRRRVRQRVEQSLHRLPDSARQMLCACAVFRRPVPAEFWYAMLADDPETAFDTLQDRHLVEFAPPLDDSAPLLVRQHNLIRSVAYDLLKADTITWETAERQAAHLWLTAYKATPNAPNLETVRGHLEAFDHYCEVNDWENAKLVFQSSHEKEMLHWQLNTWSYFGEQIKLCDKLIEKVSLELDMECLGGLSLANIRLGNSEKAIFYAKKRKKIAEETGNKEVLSKSLSSIGLGYFSMGDFLNARKYHEESLLTAEKFQYPVAKMHALGNLGLVYHQQSNYLEAQRLFQEQLELSRELDANYEEVIALDHLGSVHYTLCEYQQAIDCFKESLELAHKIGDRQGEGIALGRLGLAYDRLGQYKRAIDYHQQYLTIAQEIGDRQGEGNALVNMGATQLKLREYSESLTNNQAALEIFQEIGDRTSEAEALKNLAELHQALGEVEVARQYGQQALTLATELGIPLKAECEALLQQLDSEKDSEI